MNTVKSKLLVFYFSMDKLSYLIASFTHKFPKSDSFDNPIPVCNKSTPQHSWLLDSLLLSLLKFPKYASFKYRHCYNNTTYWYLSSFQRGDKYFRAYITSWYFLIQLTSQYIQHFLAFSSREAISGCVSEEAHIVHPLKMFLSDFVKLITLHSTVSVVSIPVLGLSQRHIGLPISTSPFLMRLYLSRIENRIQGRYLQGVPLICIYCSIY